MKAGYFKTVEGEKFTAVAERGGYWKVRNNLDMSMEALCITKEEAEKTAAELNALEIRN
ncbi:hypothetical protein FACS189451_00630 [Bacteroidia bacterium]|nr:hypothetical protein FACS189451_00630 [Bacteroidia bacterium]